MPCINRDIESGVYGNNKVSFILETDLLPFTPLLSIYNELLKKATQPDPSSINWYYQQFLKLAYAKICPADFYLCWYSDTLPFKKINMFNDLGMPYLDIKTEYNTSYFKPLNAYLVTKIFSESISFPSYVLLAVFINNLLKNSQHKTSHLTLGVFIIFILFY